MADGDHSLRLRSPLRLQPVDGYDLDVLVLVFDARARLVDFRFQLGRGLDIFSCTPARRRDLGTPEQPDERLVLLHVDSAVSFVDEPTLVSDPCLTHVPDTSWVGPDLGDDRVMNVIDGRHVVESVRMRCTRGDYLLVVGVRGPDGALRGEVMRNTESSD